jgi:hypothetical protein
LPSDHPYKLAPPYKNPTPTYDADAQAYFDRVEGPAGDNQTLEPDVKTAINDFVVGCKTDGIWDAIKASCILAGARTLSGALQPLVGTAPTNFNFVGDDYNRKTGLVGNGNTKYLDSNRDSISDPQDDFHQAVYSSAPTSGVRGLVGTSGAGYNSTIFSIDSSCVFRNRTSGEYSIVNNALAGFVGSSRSTSSSYIYRANGASSTDLTPSIPVPGSRNHFVFARNNGTSAEFFATQSIAFYSIGESLDLALLDTRVSNLITAIGAAIP